MNYGNSTCHRNLSNQTVVTRPPKLPYSNLSPLPESLSRSVHSWSWSFLRHLCPFKPIWVLYKSTILGSRTSDLTIPRVSHSFCLLTSNYFLTVTVVIWTHLVISLVQTSVPLLRLKLELYLFVTSRYTVMSISLCILGFCLFHLLHTCVHRTVFVLFPVPISDPLTITPPSRPEHKNNLLYFIYYCIFLFHSEWNFV